MRDVFKEYLFTRHILVSDSQEAPENSFETVYSLANLFSIRITEGAELARPDMIHFANVQLGEHVPQAFYRGFPGTVRALSPDELLFDQLVHYSVTYGLGDFSAPGRSLFEEDFARIAFREGTSPVDFIILDEKAAEAELKTLVEGLLAGTRPLSEEQAVLVRCYIADYGFRPERIASKDTAAMLLAWSGDLSYAAFLDLPDVIKVLDELIRIKYPVQYSHRSARRNASGDRSSRKSSKKLALHSWDRRLLAALTDRLVGDAGEKRDFYFSVCCEKKKRWCALLHQIHYRPATAEGRRFADIIRGKENLSVYSRFERMMGEGRPVEAAALLKKEKGDSALLRNISYIAGCCRSSEELREVCGMVDSRNAIVLLQLFIYYSGPKPQDSSPRTFSYYVNRRLRFYPETPEAALRRRSVVSQEQADLILQMLRAQLQSVLGGRLGRVYIAPSMDRYALPLREGALQGGFGVLPRGSRLPLEPGLKKIRAFTYWEKVDDIDLSLIGLTPDGRQREFSWRTMAQNQSDAIVFSGDQTSGYNGGSEYFDIDPAALRRLYPDIRYLVFCDNVYSCAPFSSCLCKAGYMSRDILDSGEVFEPKTVVSSFRITCGSTFAFLFGIDLETNDLVWLNCANDSDEAVAGEESLGFLIDDFHTTEAMNMKVFFSMLASELVDDPASADVIVTDRSVEAPEGAEVIREYDFERITALMN